MLACISPYKRDFNETMSTLRFLRNAKIMKINPQINAVINEYKVRASLFIDFSWNFRGISWKSSWFLVWIYLISFISILTSTESTNTGQTKTSWSSRQHHNIREKIVPVSIYTEQTFIMHPCEHVEETRRHFRDIASIHCQSANVSLITLRLHFCRSLVFNISASNIHCRPRAATSLFPEPQKVADLLSTTFELPENQSSPLVTALLDGPIGGEKPASRFAQRLMSVDEVNQTISDQFRVYESQLNDMKEGFERQMNELKQMLVAREIK